MEMDVSRIAPQDPYGALIFDCDGTLADTMPTHYEAWTSALRSFGADLAEDHFYSMGGIPTETIIERLNDQFGYDLDVKLTHREKERRYLELASSVVEIQAVADIARANRGKVPMAVASGGVRSIVQSTLTTVGLLDLFDTIVTADDVEHGKPAPDIFLEAARRMGVAPEACVVYEDGEPGIIGATKAGMRVIDVRVLWGGLPSPTAAGAARQRSAVG
jgi:beta-phosphoglucomutase-like phosphatase (HAD superfamily)